MTNIRKDYSLLYYFLLWFVVLAFSVAFIVVHGIEYVSWPKLNPLTDIVYYNGPGFRSGNHGKGLNAAQEIPWWTKKITWMSTGARQKGHLEEIELGKKRVD